MKTSDYAAHDATGLAKLVRDGEVTPLELVDAAIEIIERRNPTLNAVVFKAFEEARKAASAPLPEGPFKGVPFLIKDLGPAVAGMRRTRGSRYFAKDVSTEDSVLTQRYRQAGVVILGKTNTPELGITGTTESALLGPCRNPWNPDRIAGGSSGGAASATASGMVPFAHASDGLGSIRIPAACCGLVGLKVTRSRNPDSGEDADRAIGLSVDHVVARSVRDSAAMLDATSAPEFDSPFSAPLKARPFIDEIGAPPGRMRIAFSTATPSGRAIAPEIREAILSAAKLLETLGHHVEEADPQIHWRKFYAAHGAFSAAGMAAGFDTLIQKGRRPPERDELEPLTWAIIERGRATSAPDAMRGWRTMREMARELLRFYRDYDTLMLPVMGTVPPPIGYIDPVNTSPKTVNERQGEVFPFTPPINFTGQPAISLPLAWSAEGLPIGIQFAGRFGDEAGLIRLASQIEQARPWAARQPALFA